MFPKINHTFDLPKNTPVYIGRQDFVIAYAFGKSVLHLGCVDAGYTQQKYNAGLFLHSRLQQSARTIWGVDVNLAGLDWMRAQGWQNLYHVDIEHLETESHILSESFDLLILTEVLEHLYNPGRVLKALHPLFHPQTELILTTPNATSLSNILTNLHHKESVHPEHNYWFSYHTLSALLERYGYQIKKFALYSEYDYTQPWIGRFLPAPAKVEIASDHLKSNNIEKQIKKNLIRRRNIAGWLRANAQATLFGCVLRQWPFFADGLIAIVGYSG